jgi:tetratricopeptide (TPR) repeat protein
MELDAVLKRMGRPQNERVTPTLGREICQPQVLQLAPDYASAYIGIATAIKGLRNYAAAYAKAFEIEPNWLTAGNINREYGFALVANGEDQKAEQVFTELLAKPDTREDGLRSLAFLDLYHGRYSSAESRLENSLEILKTQNSPLNEARVHVLLSIVAKGKGDSKTQHRHLDVAVADLSKIQSKVVFGAMIGDACAHAGFTARQSPQLRTNGLRASPPGRHCLGRWPE